MPTHFQKHQHVQTSNSSQKHFEEKGEKHGLRFESKEKKKQYSTRRKRAPPNVSKLAPFLLSHQNFNKAFIFKECASLHVFMTKVKFLERRSNIRELRSWYEMKGIHR